MRTIHASGMTSGDLAMQDTTSRNPVPCAPRRCRRAVIAGAATALLMDAASAAPLQAGAASASRPAMAQPAAHYAPISPAVTRRQQHQSERAGSIYGAEWGVQGLAVRYTASGNLIRFSYRVIDPVLARRLVDKGSTPLLVGQRSRAVLQVPVMDKVGPLRQTNDLSAGKEYWMAFSNKGNLVRPGDRVDVVIGAFHADGLLVE